LSDFRRIKGSAVTDREHKTLPYEQVEFAHLEVASGECNGVQDDKQRLAIHFSFRSLMGQVRIFHSQRMQSKFVLDFL
jgi:hypothetical protein